MLSLSLSFFFSFSFSSILRGLFLIKNLFSGTGGISSGQTVATVSCVILSALSSDELFFSDFFLLFFSFFRFFESFLRCFFFRFLESSSVSLSDSEDESESEELSDSLEEVEEDFFLFFSSFLALAFGINSPQFKIRTSA